LKHVAYQSLMQSVALIANCNIILFPHLYPRPPITGPVSQVYCISVLLLLLQELDMAAAFIMHFQLAPIVVGYLWMLIPYFG